MKHFGIYANISDVQDALNAGTLENPYVATVQGNLDYNTIEQQTCAERGLCGDDPTDCHECTCEEQYTDPAAICDCKGGYYWGDECHDEPEPEFYIEDSDGNIYRPTGKTEGMGEISYGFDFQADVDATWTLYCDGNVVTANSCNIVWYHECNGNSHDVEQISTPGMDIANIAPTSPISYDEPIQHVESTVVYYGDTCTFDANIIIPYCGEDPSSSGSAS